MLLSLCRTRQELCGTESRGRAIRIVRFHGHCKHCVEGLVNLDGPNKLDARGVPGLGIVISLVSLCTCYEVASASKVVLSAIACHKSRQAFGNRRAR